MAEFSAQGHRPRNVDWKRAAALLYGDWGTSKAYVLGLAFAAAAFTSLPIIIAVCLLTAVVGYNYAIVCRNFPDGGGVYSAAREQSRLLAGLGALLLIANFLVTAALSGWSAMSYFGVPEALIPFATMGGIMVLVAVNWFGPKHSGSLSMVMAVPTVITVVLIIALTVPYLTTKYLQMAPAFAPAWVAFSGVILALSGVEAIANMTGVMPLDADSPPEKPRVSHTASKALFVVAIEVVIGTALLAWAMLSVPPDTTGLIESKDYMLRFLGGYYGMLTLGATAGKIFAGWVGVVFGVLLLSAVNTAMNATISVMYMMAQDGDLPRPLTRLNSHGVPKWPLFIAGTLPILLALVASKIGAPKAGEPSMGFDFLAHLYEISVVGAIAVSLGSCAGNWKLEMRFYERGIMAATFLLLIAVELTIAWTKPDALFFAVVVVGLGLAFRSWSHKREGLETVTVSRELAAAVTEENLANFKPRCVEGSRILVAARGITPVLRFALEEAQLRKATLCVLYVKEVAIFMGAQRKRTGKARWQDDPQAAAIISLMLKLGEENGVDILPVYAVSSEPAATIIDLAATLGADTLMLGAQHRLTLTKLLKGSVVDEVASSLPDNIQLIIYG
ncbi:MAG TPA: universal stress protein [Chthoniobacteraceae bacterium]|jgi:amino acid transporter/nucleotide-binding universal stress UspA family protein|nr:universal stress protein [Chthoniobacteraceae bacterium]